MRPHSGSRLGSAHANTEASRPPKDTLPNATSAHSITFLYHFKMQQNNSKEQPTSKKFCAVAAQGHFSDIRAPSAVPEHICSLSGLFNARTRDQPRAGRRTHVMFRTRIACDEPPDCNLAHMIRHCNKTASIEVHVAPRRRRSSVNMSTRSRARVMSLATIWLLSIQMVVCQPGEWPGIDTGRVSRV